MAKISLGKVACNTLGMLKTFLAISIKYSYAYSYFLQITLKKISLTALPSDGGASYGACIEEPDAQYAQGDTVVAR